jgi:hypothetical protein
MMILQGSQLLPALSGWFHNGGLNSEQPAQNMQPQSAARAQHPGGIRDPDIM